jgi:hypothetical protein
LKYQPLQVNSILPLPSSVFGKVTQVKQADIVITNSNPLEKIKNTQDIHIVISKGENQQKLGNLYYHFN